MIRSENTLIKTVSPRMVLALSIGVAILVACLRPGEGETSDLTRDKFWRMKVDQPADYDMVLAGDSRVLCDLSPRAMGQVLGQRIFNFGFNFAGYDADYLQAIESKLDPSSKDKVIVLGITPRAFTPLNMTASGYREERERDLHEKWAQKYLSDFMSMFRPVMLSSIILHLQGKSAIKNFYEDGLMTVSITPPGDAQEAKTYRKIFVNNKVSQFHVGNLLQKVKIWRSQGIRVFAFRPPVSSQILASENMLSGFNQAAFIKDLSRAGGQWLEVDPNNVTLADGSHVTAADVPRFSTRLALEVQKNHQF